MCIGAVRFQVGDTLQVAKKKKNENKARHVLQTRCAEETQKKKGKKKEAARKRKREVSGFFLSRPSLFPGSNIEGLISVRYVS